MKMTLEELKQYHSIEKLIVYSLDLALYQASVLVNQQEVWVTNQQGEFLKAHSLLEIQKKCRELKAKNQVLRQISAYDEMIGHPGRYTSNTLEVPIRDNHYI